LPGYPDRGSVQRVVSGSADSHAAGLLNAALGRDRLVAVDLNPAVQWPCNSTRLPHPHPLPEIVSGNVRKEPGG
jgi:hypothetical protein